MFNCLHQVNNHHNSKYLHHHFAPSFSFYFAIVSNATNLLTTATPFKQLDVNYTLMSSRDIFNQDNVCVIINRNDNETINLLLYS